MVGRVRFERRAGGDAEAQSRLHEPADESAVESAVDATGRLRLAAKPGDPVVHVAVDLDVGLRNLRLARRYAAKVRHVTEIPREHSCLEVVGLAATVHLDVEVA